MEKQTSSREPKTCPPGFQSRYTVQPGDTMYFIAQTFDTTLNQLIEANPHIEDPDRIFPGDVLCIPGAPSVPLPCSIVLEPNSQLAEQAIGVALARQVNPTRRAVTISATNLPAPSDFGDFDTYEGLITIRFVGSFGFRLYPTPELPDQPVTWSNTLIFPLLRGFPVFPADTRILVRPVNSQTGVSGRKSILENTLRDCL
ncbi:LysM domain-containing protein [Halobacteroides halobius DSM 5150]|uniref:LysM domain-containing protein n=1 Tax=Halobacteroides halobius (strain ATCC 35273 / DSM 5150 / MD-1) TaxID=748449 RepID=L0K8T2_HALHC|nr:LysM peptidoglycan-binding domain-containing protein [Halobacteroides halobius]AGB41416.1 LysM domain-containing protein [Halobacteroides halobius DSM 5150]